MWNELTADFYLSEKAKQLFSHYAHKEVPFRFMGTSFSFYLSQSLFSGFDIDAGSRFLLKSIAKEMDLKAVHSIRDIGSGTGVLGISLLKQCDCNAFLTFQDRNVWALLFSAQNAVNNGIDVSRFSCQSLLMLEKEENPADLIISNIPAKAGNAVIEQFLKKAPLHISEKGIVAIVIVKPLAELAKKAVDEEGHTILFQEENNDYLVLHYQKNQNFPQEKQQQITLAFETYCRNQVFFTLNQISYPLKTVYNLPDFDQIGYHWRQLADLIETVPLNAKKEPLQIVIAHPGQGHLLLFCLAFFRKHKIDAVFHLVSYDRLELQTVQANLPAGEDTAHIHFWLHLELPEIQADLILINPTQLTLPHEIELVCDSAERVSKKDSLLAISARSSDLVRYQKALSRFSLIRNKKGKGFKAVLMKKI